jgi:nucleoid-associated protein YgaU
MQTSPNKKTAMALGALLLAVVVGGFALWSANRADKAPEVGQQQLSPEAGSTVEEGTSKTDADQVTQSVDEPSKPATSTSVTSPVTGGSTVPESHVVKPNETLREIAKHYYNDPMYSADIEALNHLDNPNQIKAGDTLMLPRPADLNKSSH